MKFLLLHPFIRESLTVMPPLGLGYMATALKRAGHQVEIFDCTKENIPPSKLGNLIRKIAPEIVGVTAFSKSLEDVQHMLTEIKKVNPEIITIVGGPHISGVPKQTLKWMTDADFGMAGEGELGIVQLAEQLSGSKPDFSKPAGLIWRDGDQINQNQSDWVKDINDLGMPAWDLLVPHQYPHSPTVAFAKKLPTAPMLMSRGCLFPCKFCAAKKIYGKKLRCIIAGL